MHIHILGICGTFMGGIAQIARELGHRVTGSDANVYPPISTYLRDADIEIADGYRPEHLSPRPDLVIVGNALSRGNPAVEHLLNERIPFTSGPAWLAEAVLRHRRVIAVAGTHGKTTTTSLLAWMLEHAGLEPGFLVGGIPKNFDCPARLGRGGWFVIEADEYDTAFFDKRSKFVHYLPWVLLVNNVEFDHADIFPDLAAIETQFHHVVRTVPGLGCVVANHDDRNVADVLARGCWSRRATFGAGEGADWRLLPRVPNHGGYRLAAPDGTTHALPTPLLGDHNALNALAAVAAAAAGPLAPEVALRALPEFAGVKRRLERLGTARGAVLYDDFAHHPTAIAATIAALREHAGRARVVAVMEPRSNTMRGGAHQAGLAAAFAGADEVLVYAPPSLAWDAAAALGPLGSRARALPSTEAVLDALDVMVTAGDHVLFMSNGGFENIHQRALARLAAAEPGTTAP
ncbi:MAG: UDP-N-acetylmuramate:L-alanyl-gamma-D-glutamyl-meso-diaminopimelate ligase [Gammaproteobacteria bacterium]|nr:UDP-N-acetylmuramate:L-alanyl-gamma-D-glutamyl-meso-diaminopimelate ligase [Gammaproteobacteria bacterium]MBI5615395.1 UDP-N-acetylmuramate:L-alanyl-gamma-D-glutamyl-meso-diaminopimelate ligase [Gammaproteobacteria bacterium]